ncbi:ubiquitin carboxyl-terminal hydrolase 20 [Drosophila subobscura]|uniref:ubiquitin carboxyl-terminal hydrolase 20 n=1 Tax=Drosophila subobscura TaxID=7241 RepID=UPI00155B0BCD|nr:ubiquitin carboxyl-terminal hydrolase 20 [Drosophila subobscura]
MSFGFNTKSQSTHVESNNRTVESDLAQKHANGHAMADADHDPYSHERNMSSHEALFSGSLSSLAQRDEGVEEDVVGSGTGLVGLHNIANTCYMNSAIQALSNLPPLTHYFINCSDLVEYIADQSALARICKPAGLAKSYRRLMQEIWTEMEDPKEYIAPRGILYGIRSVHPMFRGYQQHDTQEFLRCFMDQLHEELTEQVFVQPQQQQQSPQQQNNQPNETDDDNEDEVTPASHSTADSESDYETCESSMSEFTGEVHMNTEYFVTPSRTAVGSSTTQMPESAPKQQQQRQQKQRETSPEQTPPVESARSIISDVFDGKLLSAVQCLTCDRVSSRQETFQDLSLPIPTRDFLTMLHQTHSISVQSLSAAETSSRTNDGWLTWMWGVFRSWLYGPSVTLYDCMASFFSADELKGDNMYSCSRCNKLRTGIKYSRVLNLPEVLCIHLKRFRHDLSYSSKISSHVYFPLEGFDMRPYVHKLCKSEVPIYNLSSVICHHGTVGGGHYTCYARNALNGRWYEFDDQFVSEVNPEVVQNCQAYVLFYQKHNPLMKLIREEAVHLSNAHPLCDSDIQFYVTREWISRLATFSEPGPINNQEMLCPHGGVLHSKIPMISQIAVPISQPLWDFLCKNFGGGPPVNILFECEICKRAAEALCRRQQHELNEFTRLNGLQSEFDSSAIYAIDMPWLRSWQNFSRGKTSKEPGPIKNDGICASTDSSCTIRCVRIGSDYAQLNARSWRLLHGIYGGGPEILLRQALSDDEDGDEEIEIIEQDAECYDAQEPEAEEEDITADSYQGNHSDTESSRGRRTTPSPSVSPVPGPSPKPPQTVETTPIPEQHNTPKSKRSRTSVTALRLNMRKRGKRNRSSFKHTDMFGAKGNYNANTNAEPPAAADHREKDKEKEKKKEKEKEKTTAFQSEYSIPISIPFQSDNFQVNGLPEKTREKGKRRNSVSGSKTNNKENVTLQKFVTVREPNGTADETDI